jgi:hypothetical protein
VYITNPEEFGKEKIYWCNGVVGEYLIYEKHLPLLCKDGRCFGFAETDALKLALEQLPFWLKIVKKF